MKIPFISMSTWIPYTMVPDIDNLTYISIYNNTNTISNDLWGPKNPSKGEQCVYCSYLSGCSDVPCTKNMYAHICSFPAGAPIAQLKGFCPTTELGEKDLKNHREVSLNLLGTMTICPRPNVFPKKFPGSCVPCMICPCMICPNPGD
jgi:hypothetical protein